MTITGHETATFYGAEAAGAMAASTRQETGRGVTAQNHSDPEGCLRNTPFLSVPQAGCRQTKPHSSPVSKSVCRRRRPVSLSTLGVLALPVGSPWGVKQRGPVTARVARGPGGQSGDPQPSSQGASSDLAPIQLGGRENSEKFLWAGCCGQDPLLSAAEKLPSALQAPEPGGPSGTVTCQPDVKQRAHHVVGQQQRHWDQATESP